MHPGILTLTPFHTVRDAATMFIDNRITGAPVVDEKGKIIGVVSQTDLIRHERQALPPGKIPEYYHQTGDGVILKDVPLEAPDYTRVREVMTPLVFMTEDTTPVREAARFMLAKHIHRIIVTRHAKPCGMLTSLDLVRVLLDAPLPSAARRGKKRRDARRA